MAGLLLSKACVCIAPAPFAARGPSFGQAVIVPAGTPIVDEVIRLFEPVGAGSKTPSRSAGLPLLALSAMIELFNAIDAPTTYTAPPSGAWLNATVVLDSESGTCV